ncbi:MAG: hypothetical protein JEZ00_14425 [Anaerolineaceae bacterium]|nr:hypothetical protein [Anaerolineaceae bacterium]
MLSINKQFNQTDQETTSKITPLGLFFSGNPSDEPTSKVNLKLSSAFLADSLFMKQPENEAPVVDELHQAHIYFPDAVTTQDDTISWSLDKQPSQSFEDFCLEHQQNPDAQLMESIILKLCSMIHLVHLHNAADYPISADMIRISDTGEPIMLLMPDMTSQPSSNIFKKTLFSSPVSAPEILNQTEMNPQAFAYNIGMLAAQLIGFPLQETDTEIEPMKEVNQRLVQWLQQNEGDAAIMKLKQVILQNLHCDPQARHYCPMKIVKAFTGIETICCRK